MFKLNLTDVPSTFQDQAQYYVSRDRSQYIMQNAMIALVKSIINEYAKYEHGGLELHITQVDRDVQRLLLAYVLDSDEEFELACKSESSLTAYLKEYEPNMQFYIDKYIDDCYHSFRRGDDADWARERDLDRGY